MDTIIAPLMRDLSNLVALSARRFSPEGDDASGASVSAVARRHGLTPQQLFGWRRDAQRQAAVVDGPAFAAVIVESHAPILPAPREPRLIEVAIGTVTVRVPSGTDSATLEAVLRAVKAVS